MSDPAQAKDGRPAGLGSLLRRLDAGGGTASPLFDRRRSRMLRICGGLLLVTAAPWGVYVASQGQGLLALVEAGLTLSALAILALVRARLLRLGSLLFAGAAVLGVVAIALLVDLPSPGVPRSVHIYLITTCIATVFLLQNERPVLRLGLGLAVLAIFCTLALVPGQGLGIPFYVDEPARLWSLRINTVLGALSIFALLVVMLEEARESRRFEAEFASAIVDGGIEAYLQPQCLADGRIVGAEALMRWRHPLRGFVSPADFIPVAERSGLIVAAGQRVLEEVCRALQRWQADPALRELPVSVNVSRAQLATDELALRLADLVPGELARRGLVKFELTESMFVGDFETLIRLLHELRRRGLRIALDDFGTGYSSLSYLRQLPLDDLKIDQSFVRHLAGEPRTQRIVQGIVHLGRDLGMNLIAEGVETRAQLEALQAMGCTQFQGFHFYRPVLIEEFERIVRLQRRTGPAGLALAGEAGPESGARLRAGAA